MMDGILLKIDGNTNNMKVKGLPCLLPRRRICTRRIGIKSTIHSRFFDFWKEDQIILSSYLLEFVSPPFSFCHPSSLLHISNM